MAQNPQSSYYAEQTRSRNNEMIGTAGELHCPRVQNTHKILKHQGRVTGATSYRSRRRAKAAMAVEAQGNPGCRRNKGRGLSTCASDSFIRY